MFILDEGEVFYIGRKTNAATAPGAERSHTHKAHAPTPTGNSALTRGAPHTGSDIRLKPHMNGAKAAGPKTMALCRARARTPFPHNICEPAPLNTLVRLGGSPRAPAPCQAPVKPASIPTRSARCAAGPSPTDPQKSGAETAALIASLARAHCPLLACLRIP
jgi:hypothetical protein